MPIRVQGRHAASELTVTTRLGSTIITPGDGGKFDEELPVSMTDGLLDSDDITGESRGDAITVDYPSRPDYVLHIIGQSNAAGTVAGPAPYTNLANMLNDDGTEYVPAGAGNVYGLEAPLSEYWTAANSVTVIKTATGGVHIGNWISNFWPTHSAAIDSATYPAEAQHIFAWIQGESNAVDDYSGTYDYEAKSRELFGLIRAKLPTAHIVDVKLNAAAVYEDASNTAQQDLRRSRAAALNVAKQGIADDLAHVDAIGDSAGYTLRPQAMVQHYDAAAYQVMANDFLGVI